MRNMYAAKRFLSQRTGRHLFGRRRINKSRNRDLSGSARHLLNHCATMQSFRIKQSARIKKERPVGRLPYIEGVLIKHIFGIFSFSADHVENHWLDENLRAKVLPGALR